MKLAEFMFAGMDPSDFTYTDNCPTSLAPNTIVNANAGSTQQTIPVSGTGD